MIDTVVVGELGPPSNTFISTTSLFDTGSGQTAELLFSSLAIGGIDVTPPSAEIEMTNKTRGGNLTHIDAPDDSIYAVPNGSPAYRFSLKVITVCLYHSC